jgi:hypothetical protein
MRDQALSPQMIIFRVLNGKSWKNVSESNELTERFSKPLRFAPPGSTSTDDIEEDASLSRSLAQGDAEKLTGC